MFSKTALSVAMETRAYTEVSVTFTLLIELWFNVDSNFHHSSLKNRLRPQFCCKWNFSNLLFFMETFTKKIYL